MMRLNVLIPLFFVPFIVSFVTFIIISRRDVDRYDISDEAVFLHNMFHTLDANASNRVLEQGLDGNEYPLPQHLIDLDEPIVFRNSTPLLDSLVQAMSPDNLIEMIQSPQRLSSRNWPDSLNSHLPVNAFSYFNWKQIDSTFKYITPDYNTLSIPPYIWIEESMRFFQEQCHYPTNSYFYLSEKVSDSPNNPWKFLLPISRQIADLFKLSRFASDDQQLPKISSWLGSNGMMAWIHHDYIHNIFVQTYGTKTFYLFPPSEVTKIYIHPKIHPHARQSQLSKKLFTDPELFPDFNNVSLYKVVLQPGDVLYFPPMWFHLVVSETCSNSVSHAYFSKENVILGDISKSPIPIKQKWTDSRKLKAIYVLIREILGDTCPEDINAILESRYSPMSTLLQPSKLSFPSKCQNVEEFSEDELKTINSVLAQIKSMFQKMSPEFSEKPLKYDEIRFKIALADYIEFVVSASFGPDNVFQVIKFLFKECL